MNKQKVNVTSLGGTGLPTNLPHSPGKTPIVPDPTSNPNNDSISPYGTPGGEGIGSYNPNDPLGPGGNSETENSTPTGKLGPPKNIPSGQSNPNGMNNPTSQPPIDPIQNGGHEPSNNGTHPNNEGGQGSTEGGKEGGETNDDKKPALPKGSDIANGGNPGDGPKPNNNGTDPSDDGHQGGKERGGNVDGQDPFHPNNDDGPYDPTDPSGDDDEDC
ncbi:hypothetical protein CROQUDRAFT_656827 [Cronartium quercuum f. sp. fusiforme G11]|uniref:Uncharacterized protein n=1 Tax=Cronartium quercuum f. sp. fusiforme G11 TaxID=708437 RepID=A0A9P6NJP8_9BASI|nr:hypothetical protein CROQUDRAFT_656827 [Cronartium quercuum f. sp. fusiforme G11]